MLRRLDSLLQYTARDRIGRRGFVYTPETEPGPLSQAGAGDVVRATSVPPWIVVDHDKGSIVFTNWPGSLWLVEVVEPAPRWEQPTDAYTRARAVRLIETASATELFGPNGNAVEALLSQAASLEVAHVDMMPPTQIEAHETYSLAWNRWLASHGDNPQHELDHRNTLAVGLGGRDSPVGPGFVLLFNVVDKRATRLEGDSAFVVDDEGETNFITKWKTAFDSIKHATMARGAPDLLTDTERRLLLTHWNTPRVHE